MSSFAESVQRNQFGAIKKYKLLHRTVKAAILDVYASFRTHLWCYPTLDASGKISVVLKQQLRGYKSVDPPTKHQKAIPGKLVFHIYKKQHSHLSTTIGQLIAGDFFLGMRSCKYYKNPKGENNQTRILWKGDIRFYRKLCELLYGSGCIHLADKVSPIFRTHDNGVKNATVTHWWRGKHLFPVQVWDDIVTRLDSYPGS